ncbi:heparan sulfate 2-O-sulfotransferase 1 [Trichonephila inaurata madagascariensis]|uniref:Heparan sulfate 2-O-sulfotransferase 1 n=1 Tax=Trichonephila inaurata madagascariensis TaxID=2747483 RepID=A0A8X6IKK0_9ARAC|nr:heparan sulfate 2-O-sulfotransferase 1 [Trichonephila inaurata madagascariensis]
MARECLHLLSSRMLQGRVLVFSAAICIIIFISLYNHFETKISKLDEARKKLASVVSEIEWKNLAPSQAKALQLLNKEENSVEISNTFDDSVIIYNRVPKTGSTSFMGVAYDLCSRNGFNVLHINTTKNAHVLSLSDQVRFVQNVSLWSAKKPALYHGHIAFLDFSRFGMSKKPIFINIVRKPLDRLVSYYYFLRYGDDFRPYVVRRRQGNKMSFDDCVMRGEKDCDPENMWLQVPFFCGHHAECWIPGSEWALAQAKRNLAEHFLLVGVTEELQDFIALLEAALPRYFRGATNLFVEGKKSHLRKTFNKTYPSPDTVAKIQASRIWQMENKFYEFVLQQFHFIRKRTLTVRDGVISDKGQQFMYEKIRPR